MAHEEERGRLRIAAFYSSEEADTSGSGRVPLEVEARAGEVGFNRVGIADLMAGFRRAVVHARVPDQRAQQLRCLGLDALGVSHGLSLGGVRSCNATLHCRLGALSQKSRRRASTYPPRGRIEAMSERTAPIGDYLAQRLGPATR